MHVRKTVKIQEGTHMQLVYKHKQANVMFAYQFVGTATGCMVNMEVARENSKKPKPTCRLYYKFKINELETKLKISEDENKELQAQLDSCKLEQTLIKKRWQMDLQKSVRSRKA